MRTAFPLLLAVWSCGGGVGESGFPMEDYHGVPVLKVPPAPRAAPVPVLLAYAPTGQEFTGPPVSSLGPDETVRLQFATMDGGSLTSGATFESSDPFVASIASDARLRGVSPGVATVCAKNGPAEACQVFVVGHLLEHQRGSSSYSGSVYRRDSEVSVEGRVVTANDTGTKRFSIEKTASADNGPLVKADRTGTRLLLGHTWELMNISTFYPVKAPVGPPSGGDEKYLGAYDFIARDLDTVFAFHSSVGGGLFLGVCGPSSCPQTLDVVPECLPKGPSVLGLRGLDFAPDGRFLAVVTSGTPNDVALHRVDPESGRCVNLWSFESGTVSDVSFLYPAVSPDGRLVALQSMMGLVIAPTDPSRGEVRFLADVIGVSKPRFSADSRYVYSASEYLSPGVVVEVATGVATRLPDNGVWTPWHTLHFAAAWKSPGGEAYEVPLEFVPDEGAWLPSRVLWPLSDQFPGTSQAGLLRLDAPVGQDSPDVEYEWLGPADRPKVGMTGPASPPERFLAYLKGVEFVGTGLEGGYGRVFVDVHDLDTDRHSAIFPGNQDVADFDISETGLFFIVTRPSGYLMVSDARMRTWEVLAIGVSGPVVAARDGSAVAVTGNRGEVVVWETATGAELLRSYEAVSACPLESASGVVAAFVDGQVKRFGREGDVRVLSGGGLQRIEGSNPLKTYWSRDCKTLFQVRPWVEDAAVLLQLESGEILFFGHPVPGTLLDGGLAPDGSAYALSAMSQTTVTEMDGLLTRTVYLSDLYVGSAPDWGPKKVFSMLEFAGNIPDSGVSYRFLSPAIWPGGRRLAVPHHEDLVRVTQTDLGIHAVFGETVRLLLVDRDHGSVTNIARLDAPGIVKLGLGVSSADRVPAVPRTPSLGIEPSLRFGPAVVEPDGVIERAGKGRFPSEDPFRASLEIASCRRTDRDVVARPIEGLGEMVVTPDGETLRLSVFSPVSGQCESVGEIETGRTITTLATSPDRREIHLAGALTVGSGPLPEAVVFRVDLAVAQEAGHASLASTLVETARIPCAPTALALADMNGDRSLDYLAACRFEPSAHLSVDSKTDVHFVLVRSQDGAPAPARSLALPSPVGLVFALAGGDVDGDGLADLMAAGDLGTAWWPRAPSR